MDQLTTTQSKTRFRPIKVAAAGLPGGPLPAESIAQDPTARPAIIRTVVDPGGRGGPATVRLLRQDEMSQPKPRMLPEQRLEQYVQKLRAATPAVQQSYLDYSQGTSDQDGAPIMSWTTPQVSRAINLSEATLINSEAKYQANHQFHPAHTAPVPHLQGWPEEQQIAADTKVEAQLEQATQLDEQLRQLETRIEKLRVKEDTNSVSRTDREKDILADPSTGELVAAISTAIVSALQEKPEAEVLPKAQNLFAQSLQQHAVTLDPPSVAAAESSDTDQSASEAMFSSIADQRQQAHATVKMAISNSPIGTLKKLRERIGDYQRMMTSESTDQAATLVKLTHTGSNNIEPIAVTRPMVRPTSPPVPVVQVVADKPESPLVQFTAPENAAVPVKIAAWDVNDFRWASVTSQMLDNGGKEIENLLDVTLSSISAKTKRVVVAGAGRGQGTTTIAVSLARAANAAGYRTLLIDADVASPELSQVAGLSAKISWLDGIGTELALGEAVIRSKKSNLCLMPLTSDVQRVTWPRFIFDNLGDMLTKAESYFDLVLVDAGPVSQLLDELSSPEQLLDAMVLVDSTAKLKEIEVYQNRLQTFGVNHLVLAENRRAGSSLDAA